MNTGNEAKTDSTKVENTDKSRLTKSKSETESTTKTSTVDLASIPVKAESKSAEVSVEHKGLLTVTETIKHYGNPNR